ncbi:unnamed protein product, partial [Lymnaea stagnalis]
DINIGVILSNTLKMSGKACYETQIFGSWGIEYPEAVAFAVHQINNNSNLLSNISLGFYILDDCSSTAMALAQGLKFVQQNEKSYNDYHEGNCATTTSATGSFNDVIGVVAPMTSVAAVSLSYIYSAAKVPLVGYITSSDELSDKTLHPIFNRVIGPDKFQAQAILEFISHMGWSYISVIYSLGPYGERAFDTIKATAAILKICIATSHRVSDMDDTDPVARSLLTVPRVHVVILFAEEIPIKHLLVSMEKYNGKGRFIWIVSDSFSIASKESIAQHKDILKGAFTFFFNASLVPEFYEYISKLNPETSTNPWMMQAWEDLTSCSFLRGTCDPKADILRQPLFEFMLTPALLMDAVNTIAYGVHGLIRDVCLGANVSEISECVRGHDLTGYIRNVTFRGYTGDIKFDQNGDILGKYVISQLVYDTVDTPLGYGDTNSSRHISFTERKITWDHLIKQNRLVPLEISEKDSGIPESVCSRPCVVGEYKIPKQLECCWECRLCRDNERIADNRTSCEPCELFTWPDPNTDYTSCSPIPLSFPPVSSTLSVLQICFAFLTIAVTLIVCGAYYFYQESRVIKASSRELSVLQLAAILLGYLTVICFQVEPSGPLCSMVYFLFCLSFDSLYAPLLVKSVRIYRIFQSGSTNTKSLIFTSPKSQMFIAFLIISVQLKLIFFVLIGFVSPCSQVALCIVIYFMYQPTARKTQPVTTEKFVELTCDMTLPGLASFLAYNLVLVLLCSLFAFKTRKLPDNFNESRFISMCVSTTLVIWLAFIPTYFTAGREFVRVLLLSLALLLNHTVALVFLFLPKIFA